TFGIGPLATLIVDRIQPAVFVVPLLKLALKDLDLRAGGLPEVQHLIDPLLLFDRHAGGPFGLLRHGRQDGLRGPAGRAGLGDWLIDYGLRIADRADGIGVARGQLNLWAGGAG